MFWIPEGYCLLIRSDQIKQPARLYKDVLLHCLYVNYTPGVTHSGNELLEELSSLSSLLV